MFKRILAVALGAALVLPNAAFAAAPTDFSDFPTDWSAKAMARAVENGLIRGSNGMIDPKGTLTRAQMAAIMNHAFGATASAPLNQYRDIPANAWYYGELARAVKMGALRGDGAFMRPEAPITRQEAFVILAHLFALNDGDEAVLSAYADGGDVASWARKETAALVKAGYVSGSNQRLNPNGSITREEFAALIDNAVSTYVDAKTALGKTVSGNTVVRADGLTLRDLTVNGDLILADGVDSVKLSNVAIKGRLVVRGGSKSVQLYQVKADSTVIQNPSAAVDLNAADSDLGKVHVRTDLRLHAPMKNVAEEGGRVTVVSGSHSAGGSGSGSSGSRPSPDVKPNPEANKLVEQVKVLDIGWGRYAAVQFAKGKTIKNCTLSVDGVDITSAVTPVTDDGSIVKWEVTDLDHAKLVVSEGTRSQTIMLGNGKGKAPVVVDGSAPDYFLLNGPVYVWDYHLTNYDAAGKVRVEPAKTTFDLNTKKAEIPFHSPDTIIHKDENALPYFVRGEAQLLFNYARGTEAEKAFVDGITNVELVSHDEYKNTLNNHLTYTVDKEFPHGDHTVACIKVPVGQQNFMSNGRYRLRVTSNGVARLFPIHLVNEVVPSLTITGDTSASGDEVRFRINNMNYGITCPVYKVEVTDPAGKTSELTKINDWFLFGDMLVLYNNHTNYFPTEGSYTVTVYADGFQTFHKTFHQNAIVPAETTEKVRTNTHMNTRKSIPVDAIASASVGGGGSSGSGEGGGSQVMNANLIVNTDLLVNAKVVMGLGLKNKEAEGIADRWDNMSVLYAFNKGAENLYTYEDYYDAVNTARTKGEYLTFAEYIASDDAVITNNRPYQVKQILEDNLLGQASIFPEAAGVAAPELILTAQTETTATFACTDKTYLGRLKKGELFLNRTYPALTAEQYTVNPGAGTLTLNTVKTGKNTLKLYIPGYKAAEVTFEIGKVLEDISLTAADITKGEPLVITCGADHANCDFFAHLTAVELAAPDGAKRVVRPEGQESSGGEIGYTIANNTMTIGKNIFHESFANGDTGFKAGRYQIVLTADYYGKQTLTVHVKETQAPVEPEKGLEAPVPMKVSKNFYPGDYELTFGMGKDNYMKAISQVMVNGSAADYKVNNITDGLMTLEARYFTRGTDNTVVIKADGYKDLNMTISLDASGVPAVK